MRTKNFPKLVDFPKYNQIRRGPPTTISLLRQAKDLHHFKDLLNDITARDRKRIEQKTRLQADNPFWFEYRKGLVTGTLGRRIVIQAQRRETSQSLNNAISKFGNGRFTNEAMEYGKLSEQSAVLALWEEFEAAHVDPQMHQSGLCIDPTLPILAGSPDIILSCLCCSKNGERCYVIGECKCPHRLRHIGIQGWRDLEYLTDEGKLRQNHSYNYQQNIYCGIYEASKCLFIIWTPHGHITLEIPFDEALFKTIKESTEYYYFNHYVKNFF